MVYFLVAASNYILDRRMTKFPGMTKEEFILGGTADAAQIGLLIFAIWTPIVYPGSLFWARNAIYILGLVIVIMSIMAFRKTPDDKPVTRGIYGISCNPYYIGSYLSVLSVGNGS